MECKNILSVHLFALSVYYIKVLENIDIQCSIHSVAHLSLGALGEELGLYECSHTHGSGAIWHAWYSGDKYGKGLMVDLFPFVETAGV